MNNNGFQPGTNFYLNAASGNTEVQQGLSGASASLLYAWSSSLLMPVVLGVDGSGNLQVTSAGGGGGGAVTVADGADVTQGALADAAVTSDSNGTVSAKLRGLVKILASVWDSVNGRLKVDGSAVTQPISAASLPLPTNAATSALQTTGNTSLASILTALGSPFQAGGSIGNTSFGISGTLPGFAATPTFNLGTLNGAATSALQTSGNTTLSSILTALGTPLQAGGSVSVSNFPATQAISAASLPLPSNAAAETGGNLATLVTRTPALGAAAIAASTPVNIASDQTVPISAAALPLPANAAKETGGNLALIANSNDILRRIDATLNAILLVLQANSTVSVGDRDDILGADTTIN